MYTRAYAREFMIRSHALSMKGKFLPSLSLIYSLAWSKHFSRATLNLDVNRRGAPTTPASPEAIFPGETDSVIRHRGVTTGDNVTY
eukprot:1273574-Amorphochlora_amoeboformis.AAC.1